ncbi:hypothetical protein Hanom_Chr09g00870591 [Helianthus anomalus]
MMSSPVGSMEVEGSCRVDSKRGEEELHASDVDPSIEILGNMQEEREKGGEGEAVPRKLCNPQSGPSCVDPVKSREKGGPSKNPFNLGQGETSKKAQDRAKRAVRLRKERALSSENPSPVVDRPKKRTRPVPVEHEPGFGFIGFASGGNPEIVRSGDVRCRP